MAEIITKLLIELSNEVIIPIFENIAKIINNISSIILAIPEEYRLKACNSLLFFIAYKNTLNFIYAVLKLYRK